MSQACPPSPTPALAPDSAIPIAATPPPNWVRSRHPLGWIIDRLLAVPPLRQLLFWQARRLIIRTAERRGIAWRARRQALQALAEPLLEASTNPATSPPQYYLARFHAYNAGNLCWQAACEAEQATDAMALRVWPKESLEPAEAQERLRRAIYTAMAPSLPGPVHGVLDLGCSVGVGTQALKTWLASHQEEAVRVEGLDLSPQMLAVARAREAERAGSAPSGAESTATVWHHAAAEATGLPEGSYDLITLQFVCHELPAEATRAVLRESARLLRPGGVIVQVDQDPDSEVIRRLPAPIATLLKSTEPYLEDYFSLNFPAELVAAGFEAVHRVPCDPRHRVLVATRAITPSR
ncbi:MAG: class I SAM-dependent methyltransferase [Cyanobacteriota bacterium]|jgi:SAM-dependent methyltransferase